MYLQNVDNVYDLKWNDHIKYGELYHKNEVEQSTYNFEESNPDLLKQLFSLHQEEAQRLIGKKLIMPGYEQILKCSHYFNLLDARGVLGRDERMANIIKISKLSEKIARGYLEQRIEMGFPLLNESVRAETVKTYREKYLSAEEK